VIIKIQTVGIGKCSGIVYYIILYSILKFMAVKCCIQIRYTRYD